MSKYLSEELCQGLINIGYDRDCDKFYERNILARRYENIPMLTIDDVMEWLREEHEIAFCVDYFPRVWQWAIYDMSFANRFERQGLTMYGKYEEAAIDGITYIIKNFNQLTSRIR